MLVLSASSESSHRLECYDYPERFNLGGAWCAREN